MKKILISLLIVAMLIPMVSSCAMNSVNFAPDTALLEQLQSPTENTPASGDANVEEGMILTEVSISTGASESEVYAGEELAKYLGKKNVTVKEGAFPISISIDETLISDAFIIEAVTTGEGAGMTIKGGDGRGVLYGVYKFLEELGGVRYFTPDLEKIPDTAIVIQDGIVLEYTPYFELRRLSWNSIATKTDWCLKNGVNAHDGVAGDMHGGKIVYGSGLFVHTLGALTETGGGASPNPCLSLDSPVGQENYQKVLKNLRAALEADPTINIVSVSQNDLNEYCHCEYCLASYATYTYDANNVEKGGTAGNLLVFVNAVAEELADEYPNLIVDTLAYNYTQAPPKGIVPRENVCIRVESYIKSLVCSYYRSFGQQISDSSMIAPQQNHHSIKWNEKYKKISDK